MTCNRRKGDFVCKSQKTATDDFTLSFILKVVQAFKPIKRYFLLCVKAVVKTEQTSMVGLIFV